MQGLGTASYAAAHSWHGVEDQPQGYVHRRQTRCKLKHILTTSVLERMLRNTQNAEAVSGTGNKGIYLLVGP